MILSIFASFYVPDGHLYTYLGKCLFGFSAHFLIRLFDLFVYFLAIDLYKLFIYFGYNPLSNISLANIFFRLVDCLHFISWVVSFAVLFLVSLSICFAFVSFAFGTKSKSHHREQCQRAHNLYIFSSMVSGYFMNI